MVDAADATDETLAEDEKRDGREDNDETMDAPPVPIKINIDRERLFHELKTKLDSLKSQNRQDESILFGIDNLSVYKSGDVIEGGRLLRILEEPDWKRELTIYCNSGIVVKAVELFKGEITSVVYFEELGTDPYELRYYSLVWENDVSGMAPDASMIDPRSNVLAKELSNYEHLESNIYMYVELKPLQTSGWLSCCVCGIQRKESIKCDWNADLAFCSIACQSVAWSQKTHNDRTSTGGGDKEEAGRAGDEAKACAKVASLKNQLSAMDIQ